MLNPKQQTFCAEYLKDFNGAAAAVRAGYSKKTARTIAEQNLTKLDIRAEISRLVEARRERLQIDADEVVQTLAAIAFTPISHVVTIANGQATLLDSSQWSSNAHKAVENVRTTKDGFVVKMHSKLEALNRLGQHLGLFKDDAQAIATLTQYGTVTKTEKGFTFDYAEGQSATI